jgi:probable rRNA maturation factor
MNVVIANRQRTKKINGRLLEQIVVGLFSELKITAGELGVNFVTAKEMAKVNWQFLQHEGPTDVITFDYSQNVDDDVTRLKKQKSIKINESFHVVADDQVYGEIFICVNEAVSQANHFKTSWQSEIVRYVVHGILHLLGQDDHKVAARRKMKREENRLLCLLAKRFSLAQLSGAIKLRE